MSASFKLVFCLPVLLVLGLGIKAQTVDTSNVSVAYVDSLMKNDSLMKDLSAFIDSIQRPRSLLAIEMGVGNGFFTTKSATAATGYTTRTFITPTVTYLHRSGLGISASAYGTNDLGNFVVYQGAITPSFDIGKRNWAAGISYTRYINKDSVSFGITPLRNDVYAYGVFKKYWLQPGMAFDFSFDSYTLKVVKTLSEYPPPPVIEQRDYNINAHTFAGIVTLQHDFEWFGFLRSYDHIAFTPTLMAMADASNYDISVTRTLKSGAHSRPLPAIASDYSGLESGNGAGLVFESIGTLLNAVYTYKHFLLSPQVLVNYFMEAAPGVQPLRVSYLINAGVIF